MKRLLCIFCLVSLIIVGGSPAGSLAASHAPARPDAKFSQRILPLDCQFQTINDGLNTIVYLTPAICQPVVVPAPQPGGKPTTPADRAVTGMDNGGSAAPSIGTIIPSPTGPATADNSRDHDRRIIELNRQGAARTTQGWLVRAKIGFIYRYQPLGDRADTAHQVTITNISPRGVTLFLQPANQLLSLISGQTVKADYDRQGNPAIAIQLVGQPSQSEVMLRIRLLANKLTTPTTSGMSPVWWPALVGLISLLALGLLYRSYHRIMARRRH